MQNTGNVTYAKCKCYKYLNIFIISKLTNSERINTVSFQHKYTDHWNADTFVDEKLTNSCFNQVILKFINDTKLTPYASFVCIKLNSGAKIKALGSKI